MAIEVQDGFNVSTNKPIDDRYVKATLLERDALVPEVRYIGLTCYVVSENKRYILKEGITNGDWQDDTGGGGGGASGGGGSGNLAFYSSDNLDLDDWLISPSNSVVDIDETSKIIGTNCIKWTTPVDTVSRNIFVSFPKVKVGDIFRSPAVNNPLMLDISMFLRTVTLPSSGLVKILVTGYTSSNTQIFEEELLSSSVGTMSNRNTPVTVSMPFTMSSPTLDYLRVSISLGQSMDATEIYFENIAVNVRTITHNQLVQTVSSWGGTTTILPWTNVLLAKPSSVATGGLLVIPPLDKHPFVVRLITEGNENIHVTVQGAEANFNTLYTDESRNYIFDYGSMVWRAI